MPHLENALPTRPRVEQSYGTFLYNQGNRLGCYFTLEYRGKKVTGEPSIFTTLPVMDDSKINSISSLLERLRRDLKGFTISQEPGKSNIIHIIEDEVKQKAPDYVLDKKISLQYSGNLVACDIKDASGKSLVRGEGLLGAIAKKVRGIRTGSETEGVGGESTTVDCLTTVEVNATSRSIRSIMTGCLPVPGYNTILWQAVSTKDKGKQVVLVQFMGRRTNRRSKR